jgi:hypothetical protein
VVRHTQPEIGEQCDQIGEKWSATLPLQDGNGHLLVRSVDEPQPHTAVLPDCTGTAHLFLLTMLDEGEATLTVG